MVKTEFNLDEIPMTYMECHERRCNLLELLMTKNNPEISKRIEDLSYPYRRTGSLVGIYSVLGYSVFTYLRLPVYKPHFLGISFSCLIAWYAGGFINQLFSIKKVFEDLGAITIDPQLEETRQDILKKCRSY